MPFRIGLDVGGTNTDAVLMSGDEVVAANKRPTTQDVSDGIMAAVSDLLTLSGISSGEVAAVMIGTTHFTNALVERRRLAKVAAIRLSLPANTGVPIGFDWPESLADAMHLRGFFAHGGINFDGTIISEVDFAELDGIARAIQNGAFDSVALTSVFSPASSEVETKAAEFLSGLLPGVRLSLSHEIGRIGLLERENATILNASLLPLAEVTFEGFRKALADLSIAAPLYISQNDGTVMAADYATRYPIRTLASGPTNSMRGAAYLSGHDNALVLDVGGTTTDAGAIVGGFPREAPSELNIEGVRTNFRMPEVTSIGVGGGSIVVPHPVTVGPSSVGYDIATRALVFGGDTVTATDVAVADGTASVGDVSKVVHLEPSFVAEAKMTYHRDIARLLENTRGGVAQVPVILVGGGSVIVDTDLIPNFSDFVVPEHFDVANAVGAAIPQVGFELDRIVAISPEGRESLLVDLRREAVRNAETAGAAPGTVVIVEEDLLTVPSLSEKAARVRIRALGTLEAL